MSSGAISARRFVLRQAALCGVLIARSGSADLSEGLVAGCSIGACIQVEGYDVGRLAQGVVYQDNARNLQATNLEAPEASVPAVDLEE